MWAADHDVWGTVRSFRGAIVEGDLALPSPADPHTCPIRFQGQWADGETGLSYNRFRHYDAGTGQYMSADPARIAGGFRSAHYALNSLTFVDPYGLANCWTANHPDISASPNGGPIFGQSHLFQQDGILNTVTIQLTGDRKQDFNAANRAAGLPSSGPMYGTAPRGYTWHHVDDYNSTANTSTMQLVKRHIHEDTLPHNGSASQFGEATGTSYDTPEARKAGRERCCRTVPVGETVCRS